MGLDRNRCLPPESDMLSTLAIPTDSSTATDEPAFDAATHDGLRHALEAVGRVGWDSPAGAAIVVALQQRAGSWAYLADRRCGRPVGSTDPSDVVAVAWLTLERFSSRTAEAQRPWAYLWTAVGNELARSAIAESQLSDPARVRSTTPGPTAVVRVGLESEILDQRPAGSPDASEDPGTDDVPPSAAVVELARRLSRKGDEVEFWLDAIGRALDVMADARRSYEEYKLRRDPYLREILDLRLEELSALSALLIGPRKGDRAAHSLLLALHRDLATATDAVVGAQARITLLRSRSHTAARQSAA
jgi:hypothetical protein